MKKKMIFNNGIIKKTVPILVAVITCVMVLNPYGLPAVADTEEEITEVEEKAEAARNERDAIIGELEAKQAELDEVTAEMDLLQVDIDNKQAEINLKEDEIKEMRTSIDNQKGGLGTRLRNMYKSGSVGVFDVLLDSKNFTEFMSNLGLVQRIYDSDQKTLSELEQKCRDLEVALDELEVAKSELDSSMASLESVQYEVEIAKENLQASIDEYQALIDEYEAEANRLYAILEEERAELQRQLEEAAAAAAAAAAAEAEAAEIPYEEVYNNFQRSNNSGFIWPASGPLTSYFGYRPPEDTYGIGSTNHGGIDIGVGYGAPVYASRSGYVSSATGWSGGYGYAVYLIHDSGFSTVYGHNSSIVVSPGEYVEQGQLIAYAGSTGNSTGPHVHFEIRVNDVQVDPLNYL